MVMLCSHSHPLLTHILPDTEPRTCPTQFCPSVNSKPFSLGQITHIHTFRRRGRAQCTHPIASLQSQEHRKIEEGVESVAPIVKMCGITSAEDAAMAARAGATYVGMIVWPKSKRSVSVSLARDIAAAARESGAEPVGVFVDENAAEIERLCDAAGLSIAQAKALSTHVDSSFSIVGSLGIEIAEIAMASGVAPGDHIEGLKGVDIACLSMAQLHGDGARDAFLQGLPSSLQVIYVLHANKNGVIQTPFPEKESSLVDWVLVDSLQGGSGEKFNWDNFQAPTMRSKRGWLLAGGLTPDNVGTAVSLVRPVAVDVSSGIAGPDGIHKDFDRIQAFMKAVNMVEKT